MKYAKITHYDTANGIGIRTVLWVTGCNHHCKECHNPDTWDPENGEIFDDKAMKIIINDMKSPYRAGLTFSGGDPLYPDNRETVTNIAREIKTMYPEKNIWLYTGYLYEEIKDLEIMQYIDILVDGEFHIEERDLRLIYCGSRNQRIIDVQKTRKDKKINIFDYTNVAQRI